MRLLIAEDETDVREVLQAYLAHAEYEVDCAENGEKALEFARKTSYDAVVMDIMMPVMDGVTALKKMRAEGIDAPVLLLTAKAEIRDRITGLDAGADDYLTKPFAMGELLARIRSLVRRGTGASPAVLRLGKLELDIREGMLRCVNTISLAGRETGLLALLMRGFGRDFTVAELIGKVWADEPDADGDTVSLYVRYLNGKLKSVGAAFRVRMEGGRAALRATGEKEAPPGAAGGLPEP